MRGIAVSKNVSNTIIKNNIVYDEDKCISIERDSYDNSIYDNTLSNCLYGVYITKNSSNNEIHDDNIENVGYGLVAADESINNVFHSNTVTDTKIQTTLEDESSIGNAFKNNKKMVSFDTLEKNNNRGKKYK
jgi:parallel beta-helix repeat protein